MRIGLFVAAALAATAWTSAAWAQTASIWNDNVLRREAEWYGSADALRLADTVILDQSTEGGWPKNTPLDLGPALAPADDGAKNTFDNDGTTLPLAFLAHVIQAAGRPADRAAFDRGFDYTLRAQYPNGGWPQFFPLREGYYSRITFNDDAMVRVLTLLQAVAAGEPPYAFTTPEQRQQARDAVAKGVDVILRTQVRQGGELAVWCAQYDERTLEPAWARRYEPPSLSGNESVGITRFLMSIPNPSPEVIAAVEGAVRWFTDNAIEGARVETFVAEDGAPDARVVRDPDAGLLWARFYALDSNRPIFLGRDSAVRFDFSEIERERRTGYRYFGVWPASLIDEDYAAWRHRAGGH